MTTAIFSQPQHAMIGIEDNMNNYRLRAETSIEKLSPPVEINFLSYFVTSLSPGSVSLIPIVHQHVSEPLKEYLSEG